MNVGRVGEGAGRFPHGSYEGGPWGKHGFSHESTPEASDVHERSNVTSVRPSRIRSSCSSLARSVRLPFTSIPFVEPRSTMNQFPFCRLTSACLRETFASSRVMSHSRERPRTTTSRESSYGLSATLRRARAALAKPTYGASALDTGEGAESG